MRICRQPWWILAMVLPLVATSGCGDGDNQEESNGQPAAKGKENGSLADKPPPADPPPKLTMPKVKMLPAELLKCHVRDGQAMPEGELPDFDGTVHRLADLYGERLTVVCFWTNGEPPEGPMRAEEMLRLLQQEYTGEYAEKGLKVVSVNVGDTPQIVSQRIQEAQATYPALVDSQGAYFFEKVATEKLPRIYLLDGEGKILWFDTVYSEPTRDELRQGVRFVLGDTQ